MVGDGRREPSATSGIFKSPQNCARAPHPIDIAALRRQTSVDPPPPWSLYTFAHHHLAQNMIHSMWLLRISQIVKRKQNVLNITEDLDMCWELSSDFDKITRCLKANVKPAMPF